MKLTYCRYDLNFKIPGGTSRGVLHTKETYFIGIESEGKFGIGEVGLFRGLSHDDKPDFEQRLTWLGYYSDAVEANAAPVAAGGVNPNYNTEKAILDFQNDNGQFADADMNAATQQSLTDVISNNNGA